jgi:sec-independent protein translocase protein TatA
MFGSLGFTELILILFIVLIIFGAGKLPQLGEGVGKAIRGFKKSVHEVDAIEAEAQAAQQQTAAAPQQPASAPLVQATTSVEQPAAPVHSGSRG